MDRLIQCGGEIRFSAENQCEAVDCIIVKVHKHLQVCEDACIQVLCFINDKNQRLPLLLIHIADLVFDCVDSALFAIYFHNAQGITQLFIKLSDSDCGETCIDWLIQIWIQTVCEILQSH